MSIYYPFLLNFQNHHTRMIEGLEDKAKRNRNGEKDIHLIKIGGAVFESIKPSRKSSCMDYFLIFDNSKPKCFLSID